MLLSAVVAVGAVAGARSASATATHTDVLGTNYSYTGIQETSSTGDPDTLYNQPTASGDALLFPSLSFAASGSNGSFDLTGSQLQLLITSTGASTIDSLVVNETGTSDLSGTGTGATGTLVSLSGTLTVLETTGGAITPYQINFNGTFSPSFYYTLDANPGVTGWSGGFTIDVSAYVPNATKAELSLDNEVQAFTETGTNATMTKTSLSIAAVPEPGTFALLGGGLLGLALRSRRRRG
jgi:PEP-CTERM motif